MRGCEFFIQLNLKKSNFKHPNEKMTMILTNHDLGYFGKNHEKISKIMIFDENHQKS